MLNISIVVIQKMSPNSTINVTKNPKFLKVTIEAGKGSYFKIPSLLTTCYNKRRYKNLLK